MLPSPTAVADAVYHFGIDLAVTSVLPAPGHRIALHISSSSSPAIEPNPAPTRWTIRAPRDRPFTATTPTRVESCPEA